MTADSRYSVLDISELPPLPCPCGTTRRAFTEPGSVASMHVVEIKADSAVHYHKMLTETYYVLDGTGTIELDGDGIAVRPGMAIRIRPGCRHRAIGNLTILNVCIPPFNPDDEWEN